MKPLYLRSSGSFKRLLLSIGHRSPTTKPVDADADTNDATKESPEEPGSSPQRSSRPPWRCFSYEEVHRATDGFHARNLVGRGGSSEVYRGELPDGRAVAVKRLLGASACARRERDFLAELGTVGHARHPNVCGLLGCCVDQGLYLVFDFSRRGSVAANLHDETLPAMGCLAPEYYTHGIVDEKTDVFAFGVFLLELVTGRKPVDGSHRSLLSWARPLLSDGKTEALVDPRLGGDYDGEQARRVAFVASLCVRAPATWRPSMTEVRDHSQVLELLEGGEIRQDRWAMPEEAAGNEEQPWWFDDLDDDDEDENEDDEDFSTPPPSSSSSTTSN
ncbi:unnamed protein product [Miscanthus lutarioriparius]|uniref:Protein kinase domain-containing protein n=1 Tax=Miscanthus lutarioriparius TaxID=422564 RepID=A0A811S3K3_9POAL|nr:unnamed protein product [Miscanthus lutarioriparius]